MQKKFRFTNVKIQKLPIHDSTSRSTEQEYTDDADVSGLKLLVGKTGNKRFLLRYTFQSKKRSMTLGKFGDIDVATARRLAKIYHAKMAEGIDPQKEKKSYQTQPTISEFFWGTYYHVIKAKKLSYMDDVQRFSTMIEPRIGDIRYPELKPIDVLHLQQSIAKSKTKKGRNVYAPSTNNRAIAIVKTMTSYAVKLGVVESNVAVPIGLLREDNIRERFFDIDQSRKIIDAALDFHNPYIGSAIAMLYITGSRKLEVFSLKWCNFDRKNKRVLVERSKNGKSFMIHLSELAFNIINNLEKVYGNPYIFVGRFEGTHVKELRDAYHKILVEAGVTDFENVNFHTSRHSVASNMISSGKFSQVHVKQQLAHSSIQSSERYIKHTPESARNISQGFADLLSKD